MTCVQCGTALPDGALFCGECGHEVTARRAPAQEQSRPAQLVCGQCGAAMNPEEIFCGECGFVARGVARRADASGGLPGAAGVMPLFASVPSAPAPPPLGWAPPPRLSSPIPPSAPAAGTGTTPPPPVPLAPRPVVPPDGSAPPSLRPIPPVPVFAAHTDAEPERPPVSAISAPSVPASTPPPPAESASEREYLEQERSEQERSGQEYPEQEYSRIGYPQGPPAESRQDEGLHSDGEARRDPSEHEADGDPTALLPAARLEELAAAEPAPVTRSVPVVVDAEPVSGAGIPPGSFLVALPEQVPAPTVSAFSRPISIIPPPREPEQGLESASAPFAADGDGDGVVYSSVADEPEPEPAASFDEDAAPAPAALPEPVPLVAAAPTASVPVADPPPGGPPALVEPTEAPASARIPTGPIDLPGTPTVGAGPASTRMPTGAVPLLSASAPVASAPGAPPPVAVPPAPVSALPSHPVAPAAAAAVSAPGPSAPTGGGPTAAQGRAPMASGPWAQEQDDEDLESTRITAARPLGGARFVLQFSTGESVTVFGTGLVGRNPQPQPGEYFDQLVRILDPGKSVSKTHLEFGQESGVFWISDRFSGNGTVLREPDAAPRRCDPGKRYRVSRGARIELGEQFVVLS